MDKGKKAKIHRLGLRNNLRDETVKLLVESPFLFMKEIIENMDLEEAEKFNFYHKGLGKFYFKRRVYEIINKKNNEQ